MNRVIGLGMCAAALSFACDDPHKVGDESATGGRNAAALGGSAGTRASAATGALGSASSDVATGTSVAGAWNGSGGLLITGSLSLGLGGTDASPQFGAGGATRTTVVGAAMGGANTSAVQTGAGGTAGSFGSGTSGETATTCGVAKLVATQAEVLEEIARLGADWQYDNFSRTSVLRITADLLATSDIAVDVAALAIPSNCTWCSSASFETTAPLGFVGPELAGVSLSGELLPDWLKRYRYLSIQAGALLRLRPLIADTHPANPSTLLMVRVMPPCSAGCDTDERRCPADNVCYLTGERYCRMCEGREPKDCACESPQEPTKPSAPAGRCNYLVSADAIAIGTCQNGACLTEL